MLYVIYEKPHVICDIPSTMREMPHVIREMPSTSKEMLYVTNEILNPMREIAYIRKNFEEIEVELSRIEVEKEKNNRSSVSLDGEMHGETPSLLWCDVRVESKQFCRGGPVCPPVIIGKREHTQVLPYNLSRNDAPRRCVFPDALRHLFPLSTS